MMPPLLVQLFVNPDSPLPQELPITFHTGDPQHGYVPVQPLTPPISPGHGPFQPLAPPIDPSRVSFEPPPAQLSLNRQATGHTLNQEHHTLIRTRQKV